MKHTYKLLIAGVISCSSMTMTAVATTSITPTAPNYEAEDAETESVSLALSGLQ